MSNSFYNHGAFPSTGSAATSASMRAELDLVAAGFDKMPTLSGNANKFIIVNSTGTALTQTDVLPAFTVTDTDFTVQDDGDNTRKFQFNAGSITTGNTRVYVMPDLDTTLVGTNVTQTLTNKTLTAPVIATIVNTGTLTLPTSTDTLVGRNTTDTLTNKTLTNPVIGTIVNTGTLTLPTSTDTLVGRQTTDTLTNKTISGASNTLSNIANGSLSNSSIVIGSSTLSLGGTLTTLAGVTISGASNTLSNIANASLTNSSITINGSTVALGSSVTVTATATNALTIGNGLSGTSYNGSSAVTIAINTGVTADLSTAQTFSNKTISGSANTLSNIANASLTNSAITIGSTAISLGATSLTLAGLTSASATTLISTGNQATSVAISAIGHSSGTVTVTTSTAHGLTTGDVASIDGVADYTFCGVYTVAVSNANVFTYSQTASGASSSGGFSTKLSGTWGLYAGGTGPSLANGPVMINASSQLPALRVTQGGSGYALIVEDAANPDTSAFIISNAGDLAINTNKFTVAAASGNTVIGGTTSFGGNIVSNVLFTDATYDIGATGANRPRDLFLSRNLVVGGTLTLAGGVNLNGNVTIGDASSDTLTINSTITSNLIFTDNTYDIGASGATRPRNLFLAGNITAGGSQTLTGALTVDSTTDTSSATTGSIQTDGGVGIAKSLYVGGNTTLGDATTDTVTVNGYMGVGGAPSSAMGLRVLPNALTGAAQYGIVGDPTGTSSATSLIAGVWGRAQTAASSYTTGDLVQFYAAGSVKGAGSTITNQHGLYINDQTQGTNNYGITSLVSSGTDKWNIYASGTAQNYFAGNVGIGTSSPVSRLTVKASGGTYATGSLALVGSSTGTTYLTNAGGTFYISNDGSTDHLVMSSSGNLGLGVTPSAWGTAFKALNIGTTAAVSSYASATTNCLTRIETNSYYDGTNYIYKITREAGAYQQYNGAHQWYTAPSGTAGNAITFSQVMTLDAAGKLLLGTTSTARVVGQVTAGVQVSGDIDDSSISLSEYANDTSAPRLSFGKSRGTSGGSYTIVQSGDQLGAISFSGADGTDLATRGAEILAAVDGTPGANDMPGRLVFSTTADGASSPTERMRLDSSGASIFKPAAGTGAVFNEDGVDADFRVESDTNTHALFVDAGNSRVGVNNSAPGYALDVTASNATALSLNSGTDNTIALFTSTNASANIDVRSSGARFRITASGSGAVAVGTGTTSTYTTRLTITDDASPYLRMASGTGGIQFNGDTASANALDDYEEGTFTGTLTGGTTAPSTPITTTGYYTKVGRLVEISIAFANKDNTGASGTVTVTGLPFTSASTVIHLGSVVNTRGPDEQSSSYVSTGASSLIQVNYAGSQTAWTSTGAGVYAYFSIVYPAA